MAARSLMKRLAAPTAVILLVSVPPFLVGPGAGLSSSRGAAQEPVTEAWVARYNGPDNAGDWAYGLAVDGAGNAQVTGASTFSGTSADYVTIKYDGATGNQLWEKRYNGPGSGYDQANALAIDGTGNAYVTGQSVGSGTGQDYATIKYSQPLPVGGIAEPTDFAGISAEKAGAPPEGSGWSAGKGEALGGGLAAALVTVTAGAWYARRRWLRTNGAAEDIIIRDRLAGKTRLASVDSAGVQGNTDSASPAISTDGDHVAFESQAWNLVPGDTNHSRDVFVHDLAAPAVDGIAELPDVANTSTEETGAPAEGPAWSARSHAALAGGMAAAVLVTAAGIRYARRRWVR